MDQNKSLYVILAFALQLLVFLCLCSVESIFFSPRKSLIELDIWIASLIFMSLHRDLFTGFVFAVLSAFFFSAFSGIPCHASILSFLCVLSCIHIIKSHSYAQGASYFSICSFFALICFYVSYFLLSWALGDASITNPHIIKWITSALTSSAVFALIRPILIAVDSAFHIKYPFGFEVES